MPEPEHVVHGVGTVLRVGRPPAPRGEHQCHWRDRFAKAREQHQSHLLDASTSFFIPRSTAKRSLLTKAHVRDILTELGLPGPKDTASPDGLANSICEDYTTIFCILLHIDQGEFIQRFVAGEELRDRYLPFDPNRQQPEWLSKEKWDEFLRQQWHFVPYTFRREVKELAGEYVLPFVECKRFDEGTTSSIWRVQLHHEYDQLRAGKFSINTHHDTHVTNGTNSEPRGIVGSEAAHNTYALKVYQGPQATRCYNAETRAFENIKGTGKRPWPPGLIEYHGAYSIRGTDMRCVWLEMAAGGTLSNMFEKDDPPDKPQGVYDFWIRLFELLEGLETLHKLGYDTARQLSGEAHCVHFDIHPRNILLVHDKNSASGQHKCSLYKYKLADLGHSSTDAKPGMGPELEFLDTKAGREFSAPELHEQFEDQGRFKIYVTSASDVFSLGAVFLVAAVWIVRGPTGVREFARERERDGQDDHRTSARFHTAQGSESRLLPIVDRYVEEDYLGEYMRRNEPMTAQVIEQLISLMLDPDPKARVKMATARGRAMRLARRHAPENRRSTMLRLSTVVPEAHESTASTFQGPRVQSPESYHDLEPSQPPSPGSLNGGRSNNSQDAKQAQPAASPPQPAQMRTDVSFEARPNSAPLCPNGSPQSAPHNVPRNSPGPDFRRADTTVRHVLTCIHQRKNNILSRFRAMPIDDQHYLSKVKDQDFIFLIDDSSSMGGGHKEEVVRAFTAMSYMVKSKDKDGIEMYYTNSADHLQERNTTPMIQNIEKRRFRGQTDMAYSLQELILKCKNTLSSARSRRGRSQGTSIIVLTDGRWEAGDAVEKLIFETAAFLQSQQLDRKALCISFVSFGDDREGIQRMNRLDDLKLAGKAVLDIVDHEPHRGGFWKMLLGGFDAGLDGMDSPNRASSSNG